MTGTSAGPSSGDTAAWTPPATPIPPWDGLGGTRPGENPSPVPVPEGSGAAALTGLGRVSVGRVGLDVNVLHARDAPAEQGAHGGRGQSGRAGGCRAAAAAAARRTLGERVRPRRDYSSRQAPQRHLPPAARGGGGGLHRGVPCEPPAEGAVTRVPVLSCGTGQRRRGQRGSTGDAQGMPREGAQGHRLHGDAQGQPPHRDAACNRCKGEVRRRNHAEGARPGQLSPGRLCCTAQAMINPLVVVWQKSFTQWHNHPHQPPFLLAAGDQDVVHPPKSVPG